MVQLSFFIRKTSEVKLVAAQKMKKSLIANFIFCAVGQSQTRASLLEIMNTYEQKIDWVSTLQMFRLFKYHYIEFK